MSFKKHRYVKMSIVSIKPKNSCIHSPSETQIKEKEIFVTLFMTESKSSKLNFGSCKTNNSEIHLGNTSNRSQSLISALAYLNSNANLKNDFLNSIDNNGDPNTGSGYSLKPTKVFTVINKRGVEDTQSKTLNEDEKSESDNRSYASGLSRFTSKTSLRNLGSTFCRICHGGKSFAELLSPCKCKGSIALAHLECLEHWLKESGNSHCELCQHHFQIIREPKYSIPMSILVFMRNPGEQYGAEMILDTVAFLFYTPLTVFTTYLLMLICENYTKATLQNEKTVAAHLMVFASIFGMAAIDFTYSSWIMLVFQKYIDAWRNWYRTNCNLKLILPMVKDKKGNICKKSNPIQLTRNRTDACVSIASLHS